MTHAAQGAVADGTSTAPTSAVCRICSVNKDLTEFYVNTARKCGRNTRCAACTRDSWSAHKKANLAKYRSTQAKYVDANRDAHNQRNKDWRLRHPEKSRAMSDNWKRNNPERVKAAITERRRKNPELFREKYRAWYAKNSDQVKEWGATWRRNNRDLYRKISRESEAKHAVARAAKGRQRQLKLSPPPWAELRYIVPFYGEARRLTLESEQTFVVDHIYPVQGKTVCGLHTPDNLRVLERLENRRKYNKLPGFLAHELWDPTGPDVYHETTQ